MPVQLDPVRTADVYGAPSYGPLRRAEGITFHTPENPDIGLASAIAVARWQASSGNTSGGSYHGILALADGTNAADYRNWVMVRSVPWNQAAGGLSGDHNPAWWQPGRFPWIQQHLSDAAYADPNAYMQQIALSGRAAWYQQNGVPAGAVTRLAQWVLILEKAYSYDALLTEHRMWQLDRSDVTGNLADLVLAEYGRITAPDPAPAPAPIPVPVPDPVPVLNARIAELEGQVVALDNRIDRKDAHIGEAIAKLQEAVRQ
jgi:hypothetical protein